MGKKRKKYTIADGYNVKDLIQSGLDHMRAAKVLRERHFCFFDSAGYLAHLGLELLLKSFLLHAQGSFPNEHSVAELYNEVVAVIPDLAGTLDPSMMAELEQFNELGYPYPSNPIEIGTEDFLALESTLPRFLAAAPRAWVAEIYAIKGNEKRWAYTNGQGSVALCSGGRGQRHFRGGRPRRLATNFADAQARRSMRTRRSSSRE